MSLLSKIPIIGSYFANGANGAQTTPEGPTSDAGNYRLPTRRPSITNDAYKADLRITSVSYDMVDNRLSFTSERNLAGSNYLFNHIEQVGIKHGRVISPLGSNTAHIDDISYLDASALVTSAHQHGLLTNSCADEARRNGLLLEGSDVDDIFR